GRIVTEFLDNPQLPVSEVSVALKSGPRAPLAMPTECGTKTTTATLTSWSGRTVELSDSFTIPCPGDRGFAPKLDAGTVNPLAGATSPFLLRLQRADGEQTLGALTMKLPQGLTAYLKGVPYCPEAAIAAAPSRPGNAEQASPSCPGASQIGTVLAGAG